MLVSELQPLNAQPSILVTPSGMVTLVSELQPSNALSPILVTLSGMVMLSSELQSRNAPLFNPIRTQIFQSLYSKFFCFYDLSVSILYICFCILLYFGSTNAVKLRYPFNLAISVSCLLFIADNPL